MMTKPGRWSNNMENHRLVLEAAAGGRLVLEDYVLLDPTHLTASSSLCSMDYTIRSPVWTPYTMKRKKRLSTWVLHTVPVANDPIPSPESICLPWPMRATLTQTCLLLLPQGRIEILCLFCVCLFFLLPLFVIFNFFLAFLFSPPVWGMIDFSTSVL